MTLAAMWEARATAGRGGELHAWAREFALPAVRGADGLERVELFTAPGERVLLIALWAGEPQPVPEPPAELLARPVHHWTFTRTDVG